jgi:lipid-binding SYLF domain-containing protein
MTATANVAAGRPFGQIIEDKSMNSMTRRAVLAGTAASVVAATGLAADASSRTKIDRDVADAIAMMETRIRGARELMNRAKGYLIMAGVTKAGLLVGGEYGEGTLFVGGAPVEYYSVAAASIGLQAGVQRSHQALFFMTEDALRDFRTADGWTASADAEIAIVDDGIGLQLDSQTLNRPVIGFVFGREGLLAGASLEGSKYSRIVR